MWNLLKVIIGLLMGFGATLLGEVWLGIVSGGVIAFAADDIREAGRLRKAAPDA